MPKNTTDDDKRVPAREGSWKRRLYVIIFEADTPAGKAFDVFLLVAILLSVALIILESVSSIFAPYTSFFNAAEWAFTVLFTLEYVLRLVSSPRPLRYIFSFFGLVDLISILPTYFKLFLPNSQYLLVIRALRLLRIFRVFKLSRYIGEAELLVVALRRSAYKIIVFLGAVVTIVLIIGAVMHLIEGPDSHFDTIPKGMYWAVVTLTTVGYGDIVPQTTLGQLLASCVMIIGYAILAVPTGIVSVELSKADREKRKARACEVCKLEGHARDANYCRRCGAALPEND